MQNFSASALLVSSCTVRELIGRRTESDRAANGIRSGGGRNPIGWRTETVGGAAVSARLCRLPEQELHQPSCKRTLLPVAEVSGLRSKLLYILKDTNVGGYGILAVVTHPSTPISSHRLH